MKPRRKAQSAFGLSLALAALTILHLIVNSQVLKRLVITRIRRHYHGRVEVRGLRLGWFHTSSLVGLRFYESDDPAARLVLTVDRVDVDLSVRSLLRGQSSLGTVRILDPELRLTFDAGGSCTSTIPIVADQELPRRLPAIRLEHGRAVMVQQGRRAPFRVGELTALTALPRAPGDVLDVKGVLNDPQWGQWTIEGQVQARGQTAQLDIHNTALRLSPERLKTLPIAPPELWDRFALTGEVSVHFRGDLDGRRAEPLFYRMAVQPHAARLRLGELSLDATDVTGTMELLPYKIEFKRLRGRAMDGMVEVAGAVRTRGPDQGMQLSVDVEECDLRQSPAAWNLPLERISGRVSGTGHLTSPAPGRDHGVIGTGQGIVRDTQVLGLDLGRIEARAEFDPDSIRFPEITADWLGGRFRAGLSVPLRAADDLSSTIRLDHADLSRLVRRLAGRSLELNGVAAGRLELRVPLGRAATLSQYRLNAVVEAPAVRVNAFPPVRVLANARLEQGVLHLAEARLCWAGGRVAPSKQELQDRGAAPPAPQPPELLTIHARAQLSPLGSLTGALMLHDLALSSFLNPTKDQGPRTKDQGLPNQSPTGAARPTLTTSLSFNVPCARVLDVNAWTARGAVILKGARLGPVDPGPIQAEVQLQSGSVGVSGLRGRIEGMVVRAAARLSIERPYRWTGLAAWNDLSINQVGRWSGTAALAEQFSGRLSGEARLSGSLLPFSWHAEGVSQATDLGAAGLPLGAADFRWTCTAESFRLSAIQSELLGGRLHGSGEFPLRGTDPARGHLALDACDIGRVAALANPSAPPAIRGRVHGTIDFKAPRTETIALDRAELEGTLESAELRLAPGVVQNCTAHWLWQPDQNQVGFNFSGQGWGGNLGGSGVLRLGRHPRFEADLGGVDLQLGRLARAGDSGPAAAGSVPSGLVAAKLHVVLPQIDQPWDGQFEVNRLAYSDWLRIPRVGGAVRITPTQVELSQIEAAWCGGSIIGGASYLFASGALNLDLATGPSRAGSGAIDLGLLARAWPGANVPLQGRMETAIKATLAGRGTDQSFVGTATVRIGNGFCRGIPFGLPRATGLAIDLGPSRSDTIAARLDALHPLAVAGGQMTGVLALHLRPQPWFSAAPEFRGVDLATIQRGLLDDPRPSHGRISGRADVIKGTFQSIDDLEAYNTEFQLDDAHIWPSPLSSAVARALGLKHTDRQAFDTARARLWIKKRLMTVSKFTLLGRVLKVTGAGTLGFNGQVNLYLVGNAQLPGKNIPLLNAVPRTFEFIQQHLVMVHVRGTLQNPEAFPIPLQNITDPVGRLFLNLLKPAARKRHGDDRPGAAD